MSELNSSDQIVDVFVSARPGSLKMLLSRAHDKFVRDFFDGVTAEDVWSAAQTRNGWQGTIDGAIVSIFKSERVRDSDVVLQ